MIKLAHRDIAILMPLLISIVIYVKSYLPTRLEAPSARRVSFTFYLQWLSQCQARGRHSPYTS